MINTIESFHVPDWFHIYFKFISKLLQIIANLSILFRIYLKFISNLFRFLSYLFQSYMPNNIIVIIIITIPVFGD